jgi:hypothetical protein
MSHQPGVTSGIDMQLIRVLAQMACRLLADGASSPARTCEGPQPAHTRAQHVTN